MKTMFSSRPVRYARRAAFAFFFVFALSASGADLLRTGSALIAEAAMEVEDINTSDLREFIGAEPSLILIDLRTQREVEIVGGSIDAPRHLSIPRGWLELRVQQAVPNADTPIVVYCGTNLRPHEHL